jgi:predicted DNA-binding protein with PD1-like motif
MIVSQFQDVRRFMGRLDPGQDVIAGFKTVCKENSISNGWIQATAVLRKPCVASFLADGKGLGTAGAMEGMAFCPSMSGNVSIEGDALNVRLYATCFEPNGDGATAKRMGLVRSGEVVLCEFLLVALDDAALVRRSPDGHGFAQWEQVQAGVDLRTRSSGPRAPEGPAQRPAAAPAFIPPDEDETSELSILDMKEGDHVDHPKFGICRIVHAPMDDKVSIRLGNGKHVDLHLGVMRVLPAKMAGGRKVFQIEVRRKV